MKLIDDKGKLFGKINIIDLLVILFLLGLTPVFYYGYKIATYKPQSSPVLKANTYQEFEVIFRNIPEKFLSLVNEGDKQYKNTSEPIAEIIKIVEKKPSRIALADRKIHETSYEYEFELEKFFNLKILMNLLITPVKDYFVYQGQELKINSEFQFSTDKYSLQAFIPVPPKSQEIPSVEMFVTVQIRNLMPEIAAIIKKGDNEVLKEMNIVIAEIMGIVTLEKSKIVRYHEGITRQFENPFYRDVTLDIRLLSMQKEDNVFYKNASVKIGNVISVSTDKYSFSGTIVNILKK